MSLCLHWDPVRRITARDALEHPFLALGDEDVGDGDEYGDDIVEGGVHGEVDDGWGA